MTTQWSLGGTNCGQIQIVVTNHQLFCCQVTMDVFKYLLIYVSIDDKLSTEHNSV